MKYLLATARQKLNTMQVSVRNDEGDDEGEM